MVSLSKYITSRKNPFFIHLKHILRGKGVKRFQRTVVFGRKLVGEFVEKYPERIETIVCSFKHENKIIYLNRYKFSTCFFKQDLFNELDIFNTNYPFIVTQVPDLEDFDFEMDLLPGCTLLVPFQDPENVGAVIRSGVAFGVSLIVILKEAANPFHPKSVRSSSGAVFAARMSRGPSIKEIYPHNFLISLDMNGRDIRKFHFPEKFLLLPGLEGPGVPAHLKRKALKIPFLGEMQSLNAAIATSIALYEWFKQTMPAGE